VRNPERGTKPGDGILGKVDCSGTDAPNGREAQERSLSGDAETDPSGEDPEGEPNCRRE